MTYTTLTFKGDNGTFTGIYYKRYGEWFPGVWDRGSNKREYGCSVRSAYAAADSAIKLAEKHSGDNSKYVGYKEPKDD